MRILVVEDHDETRRMLLRMLKEAGYEVDPAPSLASARKHLASGGYGLIILDCMLPDGSGLDLCRELRKAHDVTPVLVLTARGEVGQRVEGLDAGADDYMPKPFAVAEILARIRALRRRGPRLINPLVLLPGIEVNLATRRMLVEGREVPLTGREFAILEILLRRRGRVVSREEILQLAWGRPSPGGEGSMEVLINRLRRKLSTSSRPDPIRTHRGIGYSIGGPDEI